MAARLAGFGLGLGLRGDAVEEPRRTPALAAAGIAGQRPAELEMLSGAGDSDVEQTAFLFDGLAVGALADGVRDR